MRAPKGHACEQESRYHVTVLSNLARAYDRYSRRYDKASLERSTFPDRFFVLEHGELHIGVKKATGLLEKLAVEGNQLIVLETKVLESDLRPNLRTGLGKYVSRPWIRMHAVHRIEDGQLVSECIAKVVMISNGHQWARREVMGQLAALRDLQAAGLTVLALSRHHYDAGRNAELMGLHTRSEGLAERSKQHRAEFDGLILRWICVLQAGGISTIADIAAYLAWAAESGAGEVCFKELYVSTSIESVYHSYASNDWSHQHQVPLSIVLDYVQQMHWCEVERLPWGAPIFEGTIGGRTMRVVAYTEPSLLWGLGSGICRSWNLMADGRCFASLESRQSEVCLR